MTLHRFAPCPCKALPSVLSSSRCPPYSAQNCLVRRHILKSGQAPANNCGVICQNQAEPKGSVTQAGAGEGAAGAQSHPAGTRQGSAGREHGPPARAAPTAPPAAASGAARRVPGERPPSAPAPLSITEPPRPSRLGAAGGLRGRAEPRADLLEWKRCSGSVRWQDESWQPKSLTSRQPSSLRLKLPPRGGCWCESSGHGSSGARNFSYGSSVMVAEEAAASASRSQRRSRQRHHERPVPGRASVSRPARRAPSGAGPLGAGAAQRPLPRRRPARPALPWRRRWARPRRRPTGPARAAAAAAASWGRRCRPRWRPWPGPCRRWTRRPSGGSSKVGPERGLPPGSPPPLPPCFLLRFYCRELTPELSWSYARTLLNP